MRAAQTQAPIAACPRDMNAGADAGIAALLRVADAKGKEPRGSGRILDILA